MRIKSIIVLLLVASGAYAQKRNGNVFYAEKKAVVRDTLVTNYKYEANGKQYPIVVNKKSGSCYICKTSKNGKWYRQYLSKEIKEQVNKELKLKK